MLRYYFHTDFGFFDRDIDGAECRDIYEAQSEAVMFCGQVLRDAGANFWTGKLWKVEVASETGEILFKIEVSLTEYDLPLSHLH